jgi:hypothetical protein
MAGSRKARCAGLRAAGLSRPVLSAPAAAMACLHYRPYEGERKVLAEAWRRLTRWARRCGATRGRDPAAQRAPSMPGNRWSGCCVICGRRGRGYQAGWHPGAATGPGSPPHHAYLQAITMTFLSMVMAQIGTAFAARTDRASQWSVGVFCNRPLLAGISLELALAAAIIYLPPLQHLLSTAALPPPLLLITLPFPFIVWGADEIRRYLLRRADRSPPPATAAEMSG